MARRQAGATHRPSDAAGGRGVIGRPLSVGPTALVLVAVLRSGIALGDEASCDRPADHAAALRRGLFVPA